MSDKQTMIRADVPCSKCGQHHSVVSDCRPADHAARVADAFKALEEAQHEMWSNQRWRGLANFAPEVEVAYDAMNAYLAARRAAQGAGHVDVMVTREVANAVIVPPPDGMVPVLVSRKAIEALKRWTEIDGDAGHACAACEFMSRDLAAVLKPTGE